MKVFVVMGTTGEYSDRSEWPVRAFMIRDKAEAFEFECTKEAKTYHDNHSNEVATETGYRLQTQAERDEFRARTITKDPNFNHDYTGTDYYTVEVDLEGTPDDTFDGIRVLLDALNEGGGEASANARAIAESLRITLAKAAPPQPVSLDPGGAPVFINIGGNVVRARAVQVEMRHDAFPIRGFDEGIVERQTVISVDFLVDHRFEREKEKA